MRLSDAPAPTSAEFLRLLRDAESGRIHSDTGLPAEVVTALELVASTPDDAERETAIREARRLFAAASAH